MKIIALFLPALIAVKINESKDSNRRKDVFNMLFQYSMFAMVVNCFAMSVVTYVLGLDGLTISVLESFSFFIVYTVLACLSSTFFGILVKIVSKNILESGSKKEVR